MTSINRNVTIPEELWNQAKEISGINSPSGLVKFVLTEYVNHNMTNDMKRRKIAEYAESLGMTVTEL